MEENISPEVYDIDRKCCPKKEKNAPVVTPAPIAPIMMPMQCWPQGPCIPQEVVLTNVKLATAYVPFQIFCGTYPLMEGFCKGTVFPELHSPWTQQKKCRMPECE